MSATVGVDLSTFPRRVHEILHRPERLDPEAPALVDYDGRVSSRRELAQAIGAAEAVLRERNVGGGDRVLIVCENAVATVAFILACSRLDAWAVPVNARLAAPELERIAGHAEPRVAVFTDAVSPDARVHAERFGADAPQTGLFGSVRIAGLEAGKPETVAPGFEQVAVLLYTSGTTGTGKGVMLTHRGLLFIAIVSGAIRSLSADDRVYGVLPFSHVFGLASTLLGTLNAGGALIAVPRFDPGHLANALADGVTVFQGVPAMYAKLLAHLEEKGRPLVTPRLRYMSSGGAPLDIDWKRRIETRFGLVLNNGYGLTECSPTVSQTREDAPRQDDSIGFLLPGLEARFVDSEGVDVVEGAVGELLVRGPNVMTGYYKDPIATAEAFTSDGWLRTGDLCRRDPDGALFLVGRAKELIIRSGFNVYPPEVETALNAHPAIVQSAVIGRRVDGDEQVVAFVELRPDHVATEADLAAFLATRLAAYKRPSRIFFIAQWPTSAAGKLLKQALAAQADRYETAQPRRSHPR